MKALAFIAVVDNDLQPRLRKRVPGNDHLKVAVFIGLSERIFHECFLGDELFAFTHIPDEFTS